MSIYKQVVFSPQPNQAFVSSWTNVFLATKGLKEQDSYENLYGKTIKKLKAEGKSLMKENNVTVETFKKNMQLDLD